MMHGARRGRWRRRSSAGAWIVSSALFAVGHFFTEPHPERLAVFFPALVFGWLRARTGGIGAPALFHALCNVLASTLDARLWLRRMRGRCDVDSKGHHMTV